MLPCNALCHRLARLSLITLAMLALPVHAASSVHVYAAASLTDALDAAAARYEQSHDVDIVPVYASSSTAARQVANGAPADLYVSANERWMDWLAEQGIPLQARTDLLLNRLVLIASPQTDIEPFSPGEGASLAERLEDGQRLSVGDPAHVPAGIYARQALKSLGEWNTLEPRLARADNVRAALALVERGETPLGIVYRTDAMASDKVRQLGQFPSDSHAPITYPAALIGKAPDEAAQAFLNWLKGDEAMAVFNSFGFLPADASAH
ncbi:molybdate transport system substrate-binding protein [Modicisalibacter xianhensis]|uniref:Molybdate transport system substrate-binding protein n=1 Tax=Modicisalibacter xianhensis TaxID=442341 RepID=A0A4R8G0X7_9GAMM|nr:molybdate ABC transporter substrate-binding protein [Halomonas xianhensis]TDX32792.1 molybdate transport system substrate-binding protein [Halomonas xianhensis]